MLLNKFKKRLPFKRALVIVAHPGDETLWAGGTMMMQPWIEWTVLSLFRLKDPHSGSKFAKSVTKLGAERVMGDLDEGPESVKLDIYELKFAIEELMPLNSYDLIVTHGSEAEFIKHRRYEETGQAVTSMWENKMIRADCFWRFAYEEGGEKSLIAPSADADQSFKLPRKIWKYKENILTKVYGFSGESLTMKAAPKREAYWQIQLKDQGS